MAEKRQTTASKVKQLESTVEDMRNTMSKMNDNTMSILAKMEQLSQATPVKAVQSEVLALQHSGLDSKVIATNIEQAPIKTKGCFEILDALIEQFPNKVTVSAPHVKKDGTLGKSYILNMPRIDETFVLVKKEGTTVAQQKAEAKGFWKAVAFNGFTFTGMYRKAGQGGVFTTYIKQQNEAPFLAYLVKKGIHIPAKDGNKPDEAGNEE